MTEPVGQSPEPGQRDILEWLGTDIEYAQHRGPRPTNEDFDRWRKTVYELLAATVRPPGDEAGLRADHEYTTFGDRDVCCPLPPERHRLTPGDEAGLRAALAKGLADALTIDWPGDTRLTTAPAIADYLLERPEVRAALAAEPDREEPGLDVERLARAMDVVGRASDRYGLLRREDAAAIATAYGAPAPGLDAALLAAALETTKDLWFGGDRDSWWLAEPEGMAADIAAEYARLANPDREEPADG